MQFPTIFNPFDDGDIVCARACSVELGSGLQQGAMGRPLQGPFSEALFCVPQIFKNATASATAQILILVQPIPHLMWVPKQTVDTLSMQHCGTTLWYTAPQKTMNPMQGPLCTCRGIAEKGVFSVVVLPSVCYRCYASPSMIFCYQGRKRRGMLCRHRVCASPIAEAQTPVGTFFLRPCLGWQSC